MGPDICCATSGELRKVVEEVAEKAANSAAEKIQLKLQLELMELERRLSSDLSVAVENHIHRALGMTPQEHIIQHDHMRSANEFFGSFQTAFWKKALLVLIFGGLAFFGGYVTDMRITKTVGSDQAIARDEYLYSYPKPESNHAPNP